MICSNFNNYDRSQERKVSPSKVGATYKWVKDSQGINIKVNFY